jgi:hypothetical protein
MTLSKAQSVAIVLTPMVSGFISLIASSTVITMIVIRSNVKLSTTYRRLIVSLSTFDLIQSFSQTCSSMPMPSGSMFLAIGNETTCDIQGFVNTFGALGSALYSLSISIYFLLVIKFNINNRNIQRKYEPFLHACPILYSLTMSLVIVTTNNYNVSGGICWIAPKPLNCMDDPNLECTSKGNVHTLKFLACFPFIFVFIANCIIMSMIGKAVFEQFKRSQNHRLSWIQGPSSQREERTHPEIESRSCSFYNYCLRLLESSRENLACRRASAPSTRRNSAVDEDETDCPINAYRNRKSHAFLKTQKEISNRAFAFIIGYLMTYFFSILYRSIQIVTNTEPPFVIMYLARLFYPMQGLFNVLIYTYPHVNSCRQDHIEYSWFRAFYEVVKSGGDSDQIRTRRKRRGSIRLDSRMSQLPPRKCPQVKSEHNEYAGQICDTDDVILRPHLVGSFEDDEMDFKVPPQPSFKSYIDTDINDVENGLLCENSSSKGN